MKLDHLSPQNAELKTLQKTFGTALTIDHLNLQETRNALSQVAPLLEKVRGSQKLHESHSNPTYMRAVILEQALLKHYAELKKKQAELRESQEFGIAQVVLAITAIERQIRKISETVSSITIKDVPAIVDSVRTQMGAKTASALSSKMNEILSGLGESLTTTRSSVQEVADQISENTFTGADMEVEPTETEDDNLSAEDMDTQADDITLDDEQVANNELDLTPDTEETLGREKR
jgi:hypothetical protein